MGVGSGRFGLFPNFDRFFLKASLINKWLFKYLTIIFCNDHENNLNINNNNGIRLKGVKGIWRKTIFIQSDVNQQPMDCSAFLNIVKIDISIVRIFYTENLLGILLSQR